MGSVYALRYGHIKEEDDTIVYEIPRKKTNLLEQEQLDELKKKDPLFFTYLSCQVDDEWVRIFFRKESGYRPVHHYKKASDNIKRQIVISLLSLENLIGTPYTTDIHPNNIFADDNGNVKLVQRGIRFVLPTEEFTGPQLLSELKKMIVYLFSSYDFSDITDFVVRDMSKNDDFIKAIYEADSLKHLHHVLVSSPIHEQSNNEIKQNSLIKSHKITYISVFLIGLIAGMIILYTAKAVPLSHTVDQLQEEQANLQTEKEQLQMSLDRQRSIVQAYEAAQQNKPEEAIFALENIDDLNKPAESLLFNQYLNIETPKGYKKAAKLGNDSPLETVKRLRNAGNQDAREAILSMEADRPGVNIEQAWLNENYKKVIDIYEEIPNNSRAKHLAAKSYIEQNKPKKAMELGKDIENNDIQIASLKLQKEEVKNNDDMDDDKKDDKLDDLNDKIDKLK